MLLPISPQTQQTILEILDLSVNSSEPSSAFTFIYALMEMFEQQNIPLTNSLKEHGIQVIPAAASHTYSKAIQKRIQRLAQLIQNPDAFDIHKADQIHLKKHIEKFTVEKILKLLNHPLPATQPAPSFLSQPLSEENESTDLNLKDPFFNASPPTAIEASAQQTQTACLGKRTQDDASLPTPVSKSRKTSVKPRQPDEDDRITERFIRTIDNLKNLQTLILARKISQAEADVLTDDQKTTLGLIQNLILQDKISAVQGLNTNKDNISKLVILKNLILCGQLSVEQVLAMSPSQVQNHIRGNRSDPLLSSR